MRSALTMLQHEQLRERKGGEAEGKQFISQMTGEIFTAQLIYFAHGF